MKTCEYENCHWQWLSKKFRKKLHDLKVETFADVVEAILGAAYLTGGERAGLKCARALEVPFNDIVEWEQFHQLNIKIRHTWI